METEVKSSPDKFWAAVRDSSELFPKIFPHKYQSIEITEGDGRSAGSVRLIKYAPGDRSSSYMLTIRDFFSRLSYLITCVAIDAEGVPWVTFAKEKIEEVDDEKKQVLYSVLDGELAAAYKSFKALLSVDAKGDGSLVKWRVEYEKASEEAPEPDLILSTAVETFAHLDEHLAGI